MITHETAAGDELRIDDAGDYIYVTVKDHLGTIAYVSLTVAESQQLGYYLLVAGNRSTFQIDPSLPELHCTRCLHSWTQRKSQLPKSCPHCASPYWNKPRTQKGKKLICASCGYIWWMPGKQKPRYCPTCQSASWEREDAADGDKDAQVGKSE